VTVRWNLQSVYPIIACTRRGALTATTTCIFVARPVFWIASCFHLRGEIPSTYIRFKTKWTFSHTRSKASTDIRDLLDRAFTVVLACLHSFHDSHLSMAWSRARYSSSDAELYTSHAFDRGHADVYVPIRPREEVVELKSIDGWAFVAKSNGMVGWTPKVYLTDLALK
jgi:hypothetical protein